jgi:hypothetical protein
MPTDVAVTNNPDRLRYEAVVDNTTVAGHVEYQDLLFNAPPSGVSD